MKSSTASIPGWNGAGVLPPIRPYESGSSTNRSPYVVHLADVCSRFAASRERIAILDGLLRYRKDLHGAGITSGFQWLDGSFMERVEVLEERAPRDMDVVTFLELPQKLDQQLLFQQHQELFDQNYIKEAYTVDAYFIVLGQPMNQWQVRNIAYWYSMWSHRRDGLWKGFVQVALDPGQDADARAILNAVGGGRYG